ncbi:hypothetical protein P3T43_004639 [Paraburkholderia sp. GAS41]|jgi:hypothetical protein
MFVTTSGYSILAMIAAAFALVALLSLSPIGRALDSALPLSGWFS